MVSLAIALVAAAVTAASVEALRSARADLRRTQAEYGLGGAAMDATLTAASSKGEARLRWTLQAGAGTVDALAEPESAKLGLKAAAELDDAALARFGVADPQVLRARLDALTRTGADPMALASADTSSLWRACAASAISPLGLSSKLSIAKAQAPVAANGVFRGGEVWRIRVSSGGWVEDRLVRFTGASSAPFAVIGREFRRGEGSGRCEALAEA